MLELYTNQVLTFPDGTSMTSDQLKQSGHYNLLFSVPCVVNITNGITTSYQTLTSLAEAYGVDSNEDPSVTFDLVKAKIDEQKTLNIKNTSFMSSVAMVAKITARSFTDDQAVLVPDLYDEYEVGHAYKKDDRFTYNGVLYKVNQDHTSQEQWVPGNGTDSLYTKIVLNSEGYDVWQQPTGSHDAYETGDIVEYRGTLYKSLIDGNVWSPDSYPQGWEKVEEDSSSTVTPPTTGVESGTGDTSYPDFVQPTGAHDAYKKGDIVLYNGKLYQSTMDANVYSPDTYPQGWTEYTES